MGADASPKKEVQAGIVLAEAVRSNKTAIVRDGTQTGTDLTNHLSLATTYTTLPSVLNSTRVGNTLHLPLAKLLVLRNTCSFFRLITNDGILFLFLSWSASPS